MDNFTAYCLGFYCKAQTEMAVPRHKGSMLRGALYRALIEDYCLNKGSRSCLTCSLNDVCPISKLAATVDQQGNRGKEVPRPFALRPDLNLTTRYKPGDVFHFGIILFGDSLSLFPYVILALHHAGERGVGNRSLAPGLFSVEEVKEVNELTQTERTVYRANQKEVSLPAIPITDEQVINFSNSLSPNSLSLHVFTPLRLVSEGTLVKKLTFPLLIQRLFRRLSDVYSHWAHVRLELDFQGLLAKAATVSVVNDETTWLDLSSYSRRQGHAIPIGGLAGDIAFSGGLEAFLPYLVWGQFTHVGKDITKGNGWYQIVTS